MRSSCIRVCSKSNDEQEGKEEVRKRERRGKTDAETQERRLCEDRGRNWGDVSKAMKCLGCWQPPGAEKRQGTHLPQCLTSPADTLTSDFGAAEAGGVNFSL